MKKIFLIVQEERRALVLKTFNWSNYHDSIDTIKILISTKCEYLNQI